MRQSLLIAFILLLGVVLYSYLIRNSKESSPAILEDISLRTAELESIYRSFPEGYGFPTDRDTLDHWVQTQDTAAIRTHAWSLWAGLNEATGNGSFIWQTWYNLNSLFRGLNGSSPPPRGGPPPDTAFYGLAPDYPDHWECGGNFGGDFINTVDALLIFSIYYNQAARNWIMDKDLNSSSTLIAMKNEGRRDIPQAPEKAFIIKPIWYPVKAGKNTFTALPVWDGPGDRDPLLYNGFETWERAVAITDDPNPPKSVSVEYLYQLINRDSFHYAFPEATTVSVDQFYSLKLDKQTLAGFSDGDSCVVNTSFNYVHNEGFEEGDYLVLIAMHILTKELEDWTMQTVWWHDKPNEGPYASNKPDDIPGGTWENYLLTQAYYMAVPNRVGGTPHIAFNPYIELMVPEENRLRSNCQNCHQRAGYPLFPPISVHPIGSKPPAAGPGANYNPLKEGFISTSDSMFRGVIRTDFNWAIPMNTYDTAIVIQ